MSVIKNLIVILGLVALAGVGYYLFVVERATTLSSRSATAVSEADVQAQSYLQRLRELETISLDTAILSDTRFKSLRSFTQPITPSGVGRSNPFAEASEGR